MIGMKLYRIGSEENRPPAPSKWIAKARFKWLNLEFWRSPGAGCFENEGGFESQ